MSAFKTVEVSCLDLARLLDWCDQSFVESPSSGRVSIQETAWYREAYHSALAVFHEALSPSSSSRNHCALLMRSMGRVRHV